MLQGRHQRPRQFEKAEEEGKGDSAVDGEPKRPFGKQAIAKDEDGDIQKGIGEGGGDAENLEQDNGDAGKAAVGQIVKDCEVDDAKGD